MADKIELDAYFAKLSRAREWLASSRGLYFIAESREGEAPEK